MIHSRIPSLRATATRVFPGLSGPICGGRNVATPDPGVPRVSPPHPRETATTDCLVTQPTEPLPLSTGVFTRNHPHVTSQGLAVRESCCIAQEHLGRQRRDRSHSRVSHQQPRSRTFASLLLDSLV